MATVKALLPARSERMVMSWVSARHAPDRTGSSLQYGGSAGPTPPGPDVLAG